MTTLEIGDFVVEVEPEDDQWVVSVGGEPLGFVWPLHRQSGLQDSHYLVPSGSQRSWAAEDLLGTRAWLSSIEEAVEYLLAEARA
jgi:hypothetical protein